MSTTQHVGTFRQTTKARKTRGGRWQFSGYFVDLDGGETAEVTAFGLRGEGYRYHIENGDVLTLWHKDEGDWCCVPAWRIKS